MHSIERLRFACSWGALNQKGRPITFEILVNRTV